MLFSSVVSHELMAGLLCLPQLLLLLLLELEHSLRALLLLEEGVALVEHEGRQLRRCDVVHLLVVD